MTQTFVRTLAGVGFAVLLASTWRAQAADRSPAYPAMAPFEQYAMPRDDEIALAKSAAPDSIAAGAGVLVLGKRGFESALTSKNGFVCLVERSWSAGFDDPEFWNPKVRGPLCLNAPAVRTYLPLTLLRTRLALAGRSRAEMKAAVDTAFAKQELPAIEAGALSYAVERWLSDRSGRTLASASDVLCAGDGSGQLGRVAGLAHYGRQRLTHDHVHDSGPQMVGWDVRRADALKAWFT